MASGIFCRRTPLASARVITFGRDHTSKLQKKVRLCLTMIVARWIISEFNIFSLFGISMFHNYRRLRQNLSLQFYFSLSSYSTIRSVIEKLDTFFVDFLEKIHNVRPSSRGKR